MILEKTHGNIDFNRIFYYLINLNNYNLGDAIKVLGSYGGQGSFVTINLAFIFLSILLAFVFNKFYPLILPIFYGEFIGIGFSGIYDGLLNILSFVKGITVSNGLSLLIIAVCIFIGSMIAVNNILKLSRYSAYYKKIILALTNYLEMIIRNPILITLILLDIIFYFIFDTYTAIHIRSMGIIDFNYIINAIFTLNFDSLAYILSMSISQNNFVYFSLLMILNCIVIILAYDKKSNWLPVLYSPLLGFALIGLYDGTLNIMTNTNESVNNYTITSLAIIAGSIILGLSIRLLSSDIAPFLMARRLEKQDKKSEKKDSFIIKPRLHEHKLSVDDRDYEKQIIELSQTTFYSGSIDYLNNVNTLAKKYDIEQSGIMYDIWVMKENLEKCES